VLRVAVWANARITSSIIRQISTQLLLLEPNLGLSHESLPVGQMEWIDIPEIRGYIVRIEGGISV
jgi:hypothetical protein